MARIRWVIAGVLAVAVIGVAFMAVTSLLREEPGPLLGTVERPAPREVRPDYLDDGTPVWVIGLVDGSVRVLSGFDTHRPSNLGKVLWWCATAQAFEDPAHGSRYDPGGFNLGGPAPGALPEYETRVVGSTVEIGERGPARPHDTGFAGPEAVERDWCAVPDESADVIYHTFEGWPVHESPTEAVASAPDGWILLAAELVVEHDVVLVCALNDCTDAVLAAGIEPVIMEPQFSPLGGERFIARVRDGALVDVTRVLPPDL